MSNAFSVLKDAWDSIEDNSEKSKQWVERIAKTVKVVKNESDNTCMQLNKIAAKARLMSKVCNKKTGIGLFGESQVGKSYLVSTLASDMDGKLITSIGNKEYNFIDEINPSGGGKESTGLVTRFSTSSQSFTNPNFPLLLHLLKENEIIKIIVNSYYNDFKDSVNRNIDDKLVNEVIDKCNGIQIKESSSISIDEIISLCEYIKNNYPFLYEKLGDNYWKVARKKVIYGTIEDRANFFSVLWNGKKETEFTNLYRKLAKTLHRLDNVDYVYSSEKALVIKEGTTPSIINVDALAKLNSGDEEERLTVLTNGREEIVLLSELAALTAEVSLQIKNPKLEIIKKMDLLDFPGYRGRLSLSSLNDQNSDLETGRTLISHLFLRGKVAYLFERYTDNLEINSLIVCTSAESQINTKMEDVIRRWIDTTQGDCAEERSTHRPGLIWAITKFDMRISSDMDKTRYEYGSSGLLCQSILEKFGNEAWFNNWDGTDDKPKCFNNIFLVRKPGLESCIFTETSEEGIEQGISSKYTEKLNKMKQTFIGDEEVNRYIKDPEDKWNAVIKLNDGGMGCICDYINSIDADKIRKLSIEHILKDNCSIAVNLLDKWFVSDNAVDQSKKKIEEFKQNVVRAYNSNDNIRVCWYDILSLFNLKDKVVKDIFLNEDLFTEDSVAESVITNFDNTDSNANDEYGELDLDDLFAEEPETTNTSKIAYLSFGERIYNRWVDYMRNLSSELTYNNPNMLNRNGVEFLTSELVNYAERNGLKEKLIEETERLKTKNSKEASCPLMIQAVKMIISDYVFYFNNSLTLEPNTDENEAPILEEKPSSKGPGYDYFVKWMRKFGEEVKNFAGKSVVSGINASDNKELGTYLKVFKDNESLNV